MTEEAITGRVAARLLLKARRRLLTVDEDGEGYLWVVRANGRIEPEDPADPRLGGDGKPFVRDDLRLS